MSARHTMLAVACGVLLWAAALPAADVDQVLVLYNRNWPHDRAGTAAGQDSEEVARYYVARHTDPKTGKKPYLLALDIPAPARLAGRPPQEDLLAEPSADNPFGMVYAGKGKPLTRKRGAQRLYLLSTHLEAQLRTKGTDWASVQLAVACTPDRSQAKVIYRHGTSVPQPAVDVTALPGGAGKQYTTTPDRLGLRPPYTVWVSVDNKAGGALLRQKLRYVDYADIHVPVEGEGIDWKTLAVDVWSPRSPARKLRLYEAGRSRVGPALRLTVARTRTSGTILLNARAIRIRGDFVLAWSARTADGKALTGRPTVMRDGRLVQLSLADPKGQVDWQSVTIRAAQGEDESAAQTVWAKGAARKQSSLVQVLDGAKITPPMAGWSLIRANLWRAGYRGDVYVWLSARTPAGKPLVDQMARFFDPMDLRTSLTGPDGIRDDKVYLERIEKPVKAFLENPANAVAGRPLKDHILYLVLCHGMPLVTARTAGIYQTSSERSATGGGTRVSLGQRLEMMYYDLAAVRPHKLRPTRTAMVHGSFRGWVAVPAWRYPFVGRPMQPYLNPVAYARRGHVATSGPQAQPHFTPDWRRRQGPRFLYVCSRIDAIDPLDAMAQVDSARYASTYLTSQIGQKPDKPWDGAQALAAANGKVSAAFLEALGLPGVKAGGIRWATFGKQADGTYLPGAVDWYVKSENGCNSAKSAVRKMLRTGVTVTGGAARAFHGCPHTTSHAWWDERVFYPLLLSGYDLGEAWLASRIKLQWCTSSFGDPLYKPDLHATRLDTTPPRVAGAKAVTVHPSADGTSADVRVALAEKPGEPEVVAAVVHYWPAGKPKETRSVAEPRYRSRVRVVLSGLTPGTEYAYRVVLTDPYRHSLDTRAAFGALTFRTPARP